MLRIIDKDTKLLKRDDDNFDPNIEIGIDAEPVIGLYMPRWNGETWEQAEKPPEPKPQEPTVEERLQALEAMELERILGGGF